MLSSEKAHPLSQVVMIAAGIVVIIWGISQARGVLALFLVSLFLAVLATPMVLWLHRKGMPILLGVSLVVASMLLLLLAIGAVVGGSINSFSLALPQYQARIQEQILTLKAFLVGKGIEPSGDTLLKYINPSAVMNLTAGLMLRLGSAFSNIVLVMLTVTFILLEVTSFPVKLRAVLGDPQEVFPRFTRFIDDMKRYMVIKTVISLATGILITLWLYILGVDFPFLWGFLAFLLNYVPSLGSTMAGIPAVLLAYVQLGLGRALLVAAGYMVVNLVMDYGIETKWMGRKLGLSTLVVFLSLVFWGSLLGPVGAVLCIPLSMTLKFLFESSESTRWMAVLLGPEDMTEIPVLKVTS